jgi:small-conductance mechanosensitive channel
MRSLRQAARNESAARRFPSEVAKSRRKRMSAHTFALIWGEIVAALPAIASGVAAFAGFWLAAIAANAALARLGRRVAERGRHAELLRLGASISYWTVLAFGLVVGLGTMGINVSALVAGLGLTGFALGFALRDAVANLLAGVLILTYRPFGYGDRIAVTGFEGVVIDIDLRYTTLDAGGKRHLIPNQTMYNNPVTVMAPESAPAAAPQVPAAG